MLLAVDIGNTDIALGIFENGRLNKSWHVATDIRQMVDEYAILLLNLLHNQDWDRSNIEGVVLCSVVPPLTVNFVEMFQRYFGISPLVVGAGVKTGVRIRMDNPREVGADRIVNAVAAHYLYQIPVIIVDLGTATTFDAVSGEGDYLGGVIAPGISTAAESLFMRAAMLPRVELVHPRRTIGTNTISAMQSGIVFGYVGLVEGIVARIQKELKKQAKVVATGGYSGLIAKETSVVDEVNSDLTLVGLQLIYTMNRV